MSTAAPSEATPGPGQEEPAGEATVLRLRRQELLARAVAPHLGVDGRGGAAPARGGARVMLARLAGAVRLPAVPLQAVPFSGGGRAAARGSFPVLCFAEPGLPGVVCTGQLTSAVYPDRRQDAGHYSEVAGQLSGEALAPAETARFIQQVARQA